VEVATNSGFIICHTVVGFVAVISPAVVGERKYTVPAVSHERVVTAPRVVIMKLSASVIVVAIHNTSALTTVSACAFAYTVPV
jgi:hypothetical protein